MNQPLTTRTRLLVELVTDEAIKARVLALFESEGALFGPPTVEVFERVRFSVIKLALQDRKMLKVAESQYRIDTRDLLVSAGFANDLRAHEDWCESILRNIDAKHL